MDTLQRFEQDGIEILIDTTTGESFASVSGYARMAGKNKSTVSRRLKTVSSSNQKKAEIQTTTGFKTVALVDESFIAEYLPKDNPPMASKLMLLGVRMFLHKLAGYEVTSTAVQPQSTVPTLPRRDAVEYIIAATKLEALEDSTLKILLKDSLIDELELNRNQKALPGGDKKKYTIVKVRAKELGYTTKEINNGSSLGRFVASQVQPAYREVIGRYPVYHYEVTPELDTAIHTYFGG